MSSAAPGWYPDPAGTPQLFRWWDGSDWTDAVSRSASTPGPDADEPGAARSQHTRPPLTVALVLACGLALFVSAALGMGLALRPDPTSSGSSPAVLPSPSLPAVPPGGQSGAVAPPGQLDETTRTATIGTASLTLPGTPYRLYEDPVQVPGIFGAAFLADAVVHRDYDGTSGWSATVALAVLTPELARSGDLEHVGAATLGRLSERFFGAHETTVRHQRSEVRSVDQNLGVRFTAEVHYAVPHLASRYDTVTAVFVRLDDGAVVVAVSSVPDDAETAVRELAERSLRSLTVR